jgi:hypothetical protein
MEGEPLSTIDNGMEEYEEKAFGHPGVGSAARFIHHQDMKDMPIRFPRAPKSDQGARVYSIIDEARDLFVVKNDNYGDTAQFLGAKGQFADINRKFWKLYGMLWTETIPMYPDRGEGESVEEVLMDFIGHCALTIDFLRQEQGTKEEGQA